MARRLVSEGGMGHSLEGGQGGDKPYLFQLYPEVTPISPSDGLQAVEQVSSMAGWQPRGIQRSNKPYLLQLCPEVHPALVSFPSQVKRC